MRKKFFFQERKNKMRIPLNELESHMGETLVLQGFVEKIRDLQYVEFLILRDETGKVQITLEKEEKNQYIEQQDSINILNDTEKVKYYNEYGGFSADGKEYLIKIPNITNMLQTYKKIITIEYFVDFSLYLS